MLLKEFCIEQVMALFTCIEAVYCTALYCYTLHFQGAVHSVYGAVNSTTVHFPVNKR